MRYAVIVLLALSQPACQHIPKALSVVQDPAVTQLIRDLQAIIGLITQLSTMQAGTPEAERAIEASIIEQVDAAQQLIDQLRATRHSRAADRYQRELAQAAATPDVASIPLIE